MSRFIFKELEYHDLPVIKSDGELVKIQNGSLGVSIDPVGFRPLKDIIMTMTTPSTVSKEGKLDSVGPRMYIVNRLIDRN